MPYLLCHTISISQMLLIHVLLRELTVMKHSLHVTATTLAQFLSHKNVLFISCYFTLLSVSCQDDGRVILEATPNKPIDSANELKMAVDEKTSAAE